MSQQGLRQASVRAVTGTSYNYEGDWHALFDLTGIDTGDFNGRLLQWLNLKLGTSYSDLDGAMAAFAADQGAVNFGSIGTFDATIWPASAEAAASYFGGVTTYKATRSFSRASTGTYLDAAGVLQTAAIDALRINYDASGNGLGALLEGARTNLATNSEVLVATGGSSVTANATTAPDGNTTAGQLIEDTSNGAHYSNLVVASVSAGDQYTLSFFAKATSSPRKVSVRFAGTPAGGAKNSFDLVTGQWQETLNPGLNARSAVALGGGWYRISITGTMTGSGSLVCQALLLQGADGGGTYTGDGVSGIYAWGIQLEKASGPSSYVKTGASTVTRAADAETISATDQVSSFDWHVRYDDDSEETIATGVTGDFDVDPADLARPNVKMIWAETAA